MCKILLFSFKFHRPKGLSGTRDQWNHHAISTERHMTPFQLWYRGVITHVTHRTIRAAMQDEVSASNPSCRMTAPANSTSPAEETRDTFIPSCTWWGAKFSYHVINQDRNRKVQLVRSEVLWCVFCWWCHFVVLCASEPFFNWKWYSLNLPYINYFEQMISYDGRYQTMTWKGNLHFMLWRFHVWDMRSGPMKACILSKSWASVTI